MIGTVVVTVAFGNTTSLGNAYGACVVFVTLFTTILVSIVSVVVWRWNIAFSILFCLIFAFIDGVYLSSTLFKVPQGAWFTLVCAFLLSLIMFLWHQGKTWEWGYEATRKANIEDIIVPGEQPNALRIVGENHDVARINGLGIYLDQSRNDVPPVYSHFLRTFGAVHRVVVFVSFRAVYVPLVPVNERVRVQSATIPNFYRVLIRHGYADVLKTMTLGDVVLEHVQQFIDNENVQESEDPVHREACEVVRQRRVTYILGKTDIINNKSDRFVRRVLVNLYRFMRTNTWNRPESAFDIPSDKLVEVGMIYTL